MVSLPEDDAIRASVRPDRGREARARAWAFAFRCWQEKTTKQGPNSGDYKALANEKRRLT
jgi:hypothetical protein